MPVNERDRQSAVDTINWFADKAYTKCLAGSEQHGGTLVEKGGLLQEMECEVLDQAIYVRAIRHQLEGILDAINRGDYQDAAVSLKMLLRGSPKDTLPSSL